MKTNQTYLRPPGKRVTTARPTGQVSGNGRAPITTQVGTGVTPRAVITPAATVKGKRPAQTKSVPNALASHPLAPKEKEAEDEEIVPATEEGDDSTAATATRTEE